MYIRYNFNRRRDSGKITQEEIEWKGPYCLFGYESQENPIAIPDVSGVYLFLFFYWRQLCFGIRRGYEVYQTTNENSYTRIQKGKLYDY